MAKNIKKKRTTEVGGGVAATSAGSRVGTPAKQKKVQAKPKKAKAALSGDRGRGKRLPPDRLPVTSNESDRLIRLQAALEKVAAKALGSVRTQKLLGSGVPKMAQKLVEEAAETAIEAVRGQRHTFIEESADLLFNVAVLWHALDVTPDDVWAEMDRREALFGLAEKLPKPDDSS